MDITCPRCAARYRLDPATFPRRLLRLRCASCSEVFRFDASGDAPVAPRPGMSPESLRWARRVARTLVQDIALYQPARHAAAWRRGDVIEEFESELTSAKRIFLDQVGQSGRAESVFAEMTETILRRRTPLD